VSDFTGLDPVTPISHTVQPVSRSLRTGGVRLEALERYRDRVVALIRASGNEYRFRAMGPLTSGAAIDQALQAGSLSAALIDDETEAFLGFAQLVLVDLRHGTAQLVGALHPSWQGLGWPLDGFRTFIVECFTAFPIRKLYCEVNGRNCEVFGKGLGRFFTREAVLREHEWHRGLLTDVVFFSLRREDLYDPSWGSVFAEAQPGTRLNRDSFELLLREALGQDPSTIDENVDLIEAGHLDSLGLLEIGIAMSDLADRDLPHDALGDLRTIASIRHWFRTFEGQDASINRE
jgi:RimJ/RimL family protein N-acetyltransferase/acyl carrier protein